MTKVFLCHNRKDAGEVNLLAHRLRGTGIDFWLDESDHTAGGDWLRELEEAIKQAMTVLVCIGRHGLGPIQDKEIQLALKMVYDNPARKVIPVLLSGAPADPDIPEFLKLKGWVDLRSDNDRGDFRALINAIAGRPRAVHPEKPGTSPYLGLKSFTEETAHHFFGRERDTQNLLKSLKGNNRLLTLVGASGSGKSSIIYAGLVPAVRAGELDGSEDWMVMKMRPGQRPCHNLTLELAKLQGQGATNLSTLASQLSGVKEIRQAMLLQADTMSDAIDVIRSSQGCSSSVLLIVDQFEELFTQTASEEEGLALVRNLDFAVRAGDGRIFVVLALRADFLHKSMQLPRELAQTIIDSVAYCLAMDPPQLREAVSRPAVQASLTIEDGLAEALVDEVYGQPGDLPLLQFTLTELWVNRSGNQLTWAAYKGMGGLRGALEKKAEAVFSELPDEDQQVARKVLCRLVIPGTGTGDTRRRAPRSELEQISRGRSDRILELLIRERLLTAHEENLEVAHEALISNWGRLRGWIEDDREGIRVRHSLTEAATEWQEHKRDPSYLFRGVRLAQATAWVERHEGELSGLELDFFRESTDQQEAEQRLSDAAILDQLQSEAPQLWHDSTAMTEWLERANELVAGIESHRRRAEKLQTTAHITSGSQGEKWTFTDRTTQHSYDTLTLLLHRIEQFHTGLMASARHVAEVRTSGERITIIEKASEWAQAIESISDKQNCPAYRGLVIKPQLGLIPLRRNPVTGLWEFVHLATGTAPRIRPDCGLELDEMTGVVLVLLPGGTFWMGAESPGARGPETRNADPLARPEESPVHELTLDPFFIGKYELTQGQWLRMTGRNPSYFYADRRDFPFTLLNPVDSVDWQVALETLHDAYLQLPTEAQWEYATRAGVDAPWFTGPDPAKLYAAANLLENGAPHHLPVGSYAPNRFGLYDMAGNVWEWCLDQFGPFTCPVQPGNGLRCAPETPLRVFRGGAFLSSPERARSAYRYIVKGDYRGSYVGLRPARGIQS
jgi:formylglycine-generating enzyme required for sulfatase activity